MFLLLSVFVAFAYGGSVCTGLDHVAVIDAEKSVIPFASDYGALSFELPGCVAQPKNLDEVQRVIKFARLRGLTVTARGNGHSTGGQVLAENQIIIDTSKLNDITVDVAKKTATVGAGVRWFDLITNPTVLGANLRPAAFVDTISETTIGGIMSVGGTSALSLRVGVAIDQVVSFDCVDGRGNVHKGVSEHHDRDLFVAYRGGLGQFCVGTHFTIKLVPLVAVPPTAVNIAGAAPPHVVQYTRVFLSAQAVSSFLLSINGVASVDGVEVTGFKNSFALLTKINPAFAGPFAAYATPFVSQAQFEAAFPTVFIASVFDIAPLDDAAISAALPAMSAAVLPLFPVTSMTFVQYAARSVPTIAAGKLDASWYAPKILRSVLVPADTKLPGFVSSILTLLQTAPFYSSTPSCQMNFKFVNPNIVSTHSLLRIPRTASNDVAVEVSCLDDLATIGTALANPVARAVTLSADIDAVLKNAFTLWGHKNVKAYPVDAQFDCWASHFDEVWKYVLPLKEKFDPCAILARGVGIFPQTPTRSCPDIRGPFKCSFDGEHDFSDSVDSDASADLKIYDVI